MVRKQLNIDVAQDGALKRIAAEKGVSESEIVREAIQHFVENERIERERVERAAAALDTLFSEWDRTPFEQPKGNAHRFGLYDGD